MARVVALNCPSCGATLPEDSLTCTYCGVRSELSKDRTTVAIAGIPCPKCKSENSPGRRYCAMCGCRLVWTCLMCGEQNTFAAKYCGGCGLEHYEAIRLYAEQTEQQFRETTQEAQHELDAVAAKARADLPASVRQGAIEQGWNFVESHLDEYNRLFAEVVSPDEQAIIFRAGRNDDYVDLRHDEHHGTLGTSFVATDQSFIFLKRRGFLSSPQAAATIRIPFSDVTSVELDSLRGELVIRFRKGEARVRILKVAKRAGYELSTVAADAMAVLLAPFLPTDVVSNWPFHSSKLRDIAKVGNYLTNPLRLDSLLPPTSSPEALGPLK